MSDRCIIYGLVDPRTDAVRYVGKSTSGMVRPKHHGYPCVVKKDHTHKGAWIRCLQRLGLRYEIRVLGVSSAETLSSDEKRWITTGLAAGWPLVNHCLGGEGVAHPPEHYYRLSSLFRGKRLTPARLAAVRAAAKKRRGIPRSSETKVKLSIASKKQFSFSENRLKASRAKGGRAIKDQYQTSYPSISEAARTLGLPASNIGNVVRGRRNSVGGYVFSYA